jgi:hypothetical protein
MEEVAYSNPKTFGDYLYISPIFSSENCINFTSFHKSQSLFLITTFLALIAPV